jgi:hypothetical protein
MDAVEVSIFTKPVRLAFDPSKSEGLFREMWENPIARDIYLAIAPNYLRSQYFVGDCLAVAVRIKEKFPRDTRDLDNIMSYSKDPVLRSLWGVNYSKTYSYETREKLDKEYRKKKLAREFRLRELLDCVRGIKHVSWEVNNESV